jgi:hypothetical protein
MARASGVPILEMLGRHAFSYTLLYRGEFYRALEIAEGGLAFYDPQQDKQIANSF